MENLLSAWQEFIKGKRFKTDVQIFSRNLYDNILQLHQDLANKTYKHEGYHRFKVSDPKPRDISKASVRDRLIHHAVYRVLYPFFDQQFIFDSYSCRLKKGTHKAIKRLHSMYLDASDFDRKTVWALKLDIRKFFANIDHEILLNILIKYISDQEIIWLLQEIIKSFHNTSEYKNNDRAFCTQGLPLGNLTSQLFVNIYMNEFDQFVKHKLKVKHYIRYADDFVILSTDKQQLINQLTTLKQFLKDYLKLDLHQDKIILKTYASGIDFLGWISFPNHRVLRTSTKRRMFKKINQNNLQSYLGLIGHGNALKCGIMLRQLVNF